MAATELAKAYVQIVPSADGITDSMTAVLEPEASRAGQQAGAQFSGGFSGGISSAVQMGVGAIGTVVSAVGSATGAFIDGVGSVSEYGNNIDKMAQKMGMSIESYQEWDAVMQHSGASMEAMKSSMKTLANAAESGSEAFTQLGISQEEIANMSQEQLFERTISALQNVEDSTQRTYLAGKVLGRGATELGALLNTSAEDTQAMRDRVRELGGVMSEDAVKAAAAYQDSLQDMQTAMAGFGRGLVADFLGPFTEIMDGITTIFSGDAEGGVGKIVTGISDIGTAIVNGVPELAAHASELVAGVIGAIAEGMPEFIAQGTEMVANAATGFIEGLPEMITSAGELVTQVINYLMENGPQMLEQGVNMVTQIAGGIVQNLPAIVTAIASVIVQILASIGEHLPEILQKGIELLGQLLAGIVEAIPKIPGEIAKVINGIKGEFEKFNWKDIGDKIIEGIKTGLTSAAGKLKEAALDAAKKAFQAVKDFFGIKSPSKLMHDEIGAYIPAGIALGIEDNLGLVTDAMDDLSATATGTISANVRANAPTAGQCLRSSGTG